MITQIAWKNVWRNKSRSLIVIAAVTIGVFAGVFSIALMNSSVVQRIDAAVNEELSHIQVNNKGFRSSGDINSIIPDPGEVLETVRSAPGVTAVTSRIIVTGIASTATSSAGVEINGINTRQEREIFTLNNRIIPGTGTYFESETRYNSVLRGEKLAKELNIIRYIINDETISGLISDGVPQSVAEKLTPLKDERFSSEKKFNRALEKVLDQAEQRKHIVKIREKAWSYREGARLILTFLDHNNIQTGAAFRICGIYRTNNDMFEAMSVFVPEDELRELTGLGENEFHRIIARLSDNTLTETSAGYLKEKLMGYEVMSWKEVQPDLAMLADMMQQVFGIFMGLILAALAFGIVNTMLMSVLERTRELGMLAAIGMNRSRVFRMIMLESVFLSIVGGISGMAVAGVAIAATAKNGINLVKYSEGLEAFGYSAHLFPTIDTGFFVMTTILIVITGILSAVYPARKALKLNPVEALRKE